MDFQNGNKQIGFTLLFFWFWCGQVEQFGQPEIENGARQVGFSSTCPTGQVGKKLMSSPGCRINIVSHMLALCNHLW